MDDQGGHTVDEKVDKEDRKTIEELQNVKKIAWRKRWKICLMATNIYAFVNFLHGFFRKTCDILQLLAGKSDKLLPGLVHFFCLHCQ